MTPQPGRGRRGGLPALRGGIVEFGGAAGPIMEALQLPPGRAHSTGMLASYLRDRLAVLTMQGEDLPHEPDRPRPPGAGHPRVPGRPAHLPNAPARARHRCPLGPRLAEVLRAAGATDTFWVTSPPTPGHANDRTGMRAPTSRHIMGTARMGTDPRTSVFDPHQRCWEIENLVCADSSVFPTSAGYGPTLTLVALSIRAARALAASI